MSAIRHWLDEGNSILLVPGWRNSGPQHWQSRWQLRHPGLLRVEQDNWETPDINDWGMRLNETIYKAPGRILLVAHSLGCLTVAHWSERYRFTRARIHAALLVAPADSERSNVPWRGSGFAPRSSEHLPFPSLLVASDNDYACTPHAARRMASDWGCTLLTLANAGHINADSGLGDWDYGLTLADYLLGSASASAAAAI